MTPIKMMRRAAGTLWRRGPRLNLIHRWRRALRGEPALPAAPIRSALVLCHGNLFRSPFAEALLAASVPELRVASGGLHAAQDHSSPARAIDLAAHFGVDLKNHRTTPVGDKNVSEADLILVMEGAQLDELARLYPLSRPKIRVLGDFLELRPRDLPDPWGEDAIVGRVIFSRVERAVESLVNRLVPEAGAEGVPERVPEGKTERALQAGPEGGDGAG